MLLNSCTPLWCEQAKWIWTRKYESLVFHLTDVCSNLRAIFCWNPHQTWMYGPVGPRDIAVLGHAQNNKIYKGNLILLLLYLKINISEFRLILLDHITYATRSREMSHMSAIFNFEFDIICSTSYFKFYSLIQTP